MEKRVKKRLSWLLAFSLLSTSVGVWSNGGMQAEADGEVPVIKITKEGVNGTDIDYSGFGESDMLYLVGLDGIKPLVEQGMVSFGLVKKESQTPVKWKAVVKTSSQFEVVSWGSDTALTVKAGEKYSNAIKVKGYSGTDYKYISAIVTPKNGGDVVAYGVLDDIDTSKNDMEIGFTMPAGVSDGEYMLYLYAEGENNYLATNFQSKEIKVGEVTAEATPTASPVASADPTASAEPSVSPEPTATAVVTPLPAVSTVPVPPVTTAPTPLPVQSIAPTAVPTLAPTAVPTVTPTKQPVQPTQAPTPPVPTVTPTVRPTPVAATAVPTLVPVPSNTPAIASSRPVQTLAPVPSNRPAVNNRPASTLAPVPSNTPAVATQPTAAPAETMVPVETPDSDNQVPEPGSTVEQENATYTVTESGGVALDKIEVSQNQKEMTIPDTVMVNGQECKVDTISAGAFAGNKKIEQVTLGKNIKNIEKKAFSGCKNLKQVTLSNKVTTVGAESFFGCTSLKKVTLPDSVKTIGAKAFKGCKSLKNVRLGKKAGKVKGGAVSAVPYIRTSKNGVVTVETVPTYSAGSSPALTIGNYAFAACSSLKKVIINSAVRVIGSSAFRGCKKLSDITVNSQILEKVRKLALKGINNCTITVPTNKFKPYRTLFRNKGQGKKVLIAKA